MKSLHVIAIVFLFCSLSFVHGPMPDANRDTFVPFKDGFVPQTVDAMWAGYNPMKEPLDVEVLDEWEEDGIICKVIRYRVGVFKHKKSMMAAVYAYPKETENLPGLVQVHGGGQHASLNQVTTNARRGYACISINWLANQMSGLSVPVS